MITGPMPQQTPGSRCPADRVETGRWRADFSLLALVILMLFTANLSIAVSQIALGLALAVLLWRVTVWRERLGGLGLGPMTLLIAGWALVTIPFSCDPAQSLVYYRRFFLFTAIWVTAAAGITESRRGWLLLAMLAGASLLSVIGLVRIHREIGAFWMVRFSDLSNQMTSACLLMMVLLMAIAFFLVRGRPRKLGWLVLLAAVPVAFALLQTMTRSAWLGFGCGLAAMLLLARPRLFVVFSVVAVLGVVAVLNWPSSDLEGRLRDRLDLRGLGEDANTIMRLQMWQAGLRMIEDRPWIGFGDCDLREPSRPYYDQDENEPVLFGHLHSNPITLAVIWGIPGLVLVTAHFVLQLVLLWRAWRRARGDPDNVPPLARTWILGGIGVWAGFSVAGLTEWYFGDAESMLLYLGIIGVALRAGQAGLEGEPGPRPG